MKGLICLFSFLFLLCSCEEQPTAPTEPKPVENPLIGKWIEILDSLKAREDWDDLNNSRTDFGMFNFWIDTLIISNTDFHLKISREMSGIDTVSNYYSNYEDKDTYSYDAKRSRMVMYTEYFDGRRDSIYCYVKISNDTLYRIEDLNDTAYVPFFDGPRVRVR